MTSNVAKATIGNDDVRAAANRIRELVDPSPVIRSPWLSDIAGAAVWLKLENLQPPGSFKIRGAANKMLTLTPEQRSRGVITCSGGNHGAAVAYVAQRLGIRATVCVPRNVDLVKLQAIQAAGAEAVVDGATFDTALEGSFRIARERNLTYVHPFDDPHVIAGQGTIGLEIQGQVPDATVIAAAVSGGGLAGGIGAAVQGSRPEVRVVGVSAERAPTMALSAKAGHPVDVPYQDTLAEVLTGTIGANNEFSLPAVRAFVDRHILVAEEHIAAAMIGALRRHRIVVEGGGAVPMAAVLSGQLGARDGANDTSGGADASGGVIVLVVSGGNVDPAAVLALG